MDDLDLGSDLVTFDKEADGIKTGATTILVGGGIDRQPKSSKSLMLEILDLRIGMCSLLTTSMLYF